MLQDNRKDSFQNAFSQNFMMGCEFHNVEYMISPFLLVQEVTKQDELTKRAVIVTQTEPPRLSQSCCFVNMEYCFVIISDSLVFT